MNIGRLRHNADSLDPGHRWRVPYSTEKQRGSRSGDAVLMKGFTPTNRTPYWLTVVFFLTFVGLSCEQFNKLTAAQIKDILDHPRNYENKELTIHGTVTESASILIAKYFVLQDNTGSIKVFTDRVLPKKGEQLTVTGYMDSIEIGPERWIVLREKSSKPS
jgi:hypothetical protein